jgi:hypothetical protein
LVFIQEERVNRPGDLPLDSRMVGRALLLELLCPIQQRDPAGDGTGPIDWCLTHQMHLPFAQR